MAHAERVKTIWQEFLKIFFLSVRCDAIHTAHAQHAQALPVSHNETQALARLLKPSPSPRD